MIEITSWSYLIRALRYELLSCVTFNLCRKFTQIRLLESLRYREFFFLKLKTLFEAQTADEIPQMGFLRPSNGCHSTEKHHSSLTIIQLSKGCAMTTLSTWLPKIRPKAGPLRDLFIGDRKQLSLSRSSDSVDFR